MRREPIMKTVNYILLTTTLAAVALVGLGCREVNIVVGGRRPVAGPSPSPHSWRALRLHRPGPGHVWRLGRNYTIRWYAPHRVRFVRVYFSRNGGGAWQYLGSRRASDGRMTWHVPHHPGFLTHHALIRIVDRDNPHNAAMSGHFRISH